MINKLASYCSVWDLKVNLAKSKIVVFRKRGQLKKAYKWSYNNENIDVVSGYKYLGVYLKSSGSYVKHLNNQLSVAKMGLNAVYRNVFYMKTTNLTPFF